MKLVIFDVDGTLMDSQAMIVASLTAAFADHGLEPPSRAGMLSIVGLSLVTAMGTLRPADPADLHERLAQSYKTAFWDFRNSNTHPEIPFAGALDALHRLRARSDVYLGIATGKSQRGVRHIVDQFGLHDYFATIQTADDAPSKPHPGMILQAMAECGVAPENTAMIGDAVYDMEMARAAGVAPIAVAWGFQPVSRLREAGARMVLNDFSDLDGALDELWERAPA